MERTSTKILNNAMNLSEMLFEDYRYKFHTVKEFEPAFVELAEEEVEGLIKRSESSQQVEDAIVATLSRQ